MALVVAVTTSEGTVRGIRSADGVAAFKGVPYAAPPTGRDHLRPPRPAPRRRAAFDAADYGPTVAKAPYRPPYDRLLPEVDIPGEASLNLNIWTREPGGRAPVMVWLHGGGFSTGPDQCPVTTGRRSPGTGWCWSRSTTGSARRATSIWATGRPT